MKIKILFWLTLFGPIFSFGQDLYLQNAFQNTLDNALLSTQSNPGAIMKIHIPGQWDWQGASGHAITGNATGFPAVLANGTEQFRCGSLSKIFVATAIMQLAENGILNLTDSIGKYLRPTLVQDTIQSSATVTISQLLNHTSGIANSADNVSCFQDAIADLSQYKSPEEAIVCGTGQGELFAPGTSWYYSNTNYTLLAMILEEASGISYHQYVQDSLLTPLNMTETYYPTANDTLGVNHMSCNWTNGVNMDFSVVDASLYWGWADLVSSTSDLITFYKNLREGNILNPSTVTSMITVIGSAQNYGYGQELRTLMGNNYFGHSGDVGNVSGVYFAEISTSEFPNGYYIAYNLSYQDPGASFISNVDAAVMSLLEDYYAGTEDLTDSPITVNQVGNMLQLRSATTPFEAQLFSLNGQLLSSVNQTTTIDFDLNNYSEGIYLVALKTAKQTTTFKVIRL